MNNLREALQDYLALRRGLGFKMRAAGFLLPRFVAFKFSDTLCAIMIPAPVGRFCLLQAL